MATERIHQQGSLASLRKQIPVRKLSARYTTKPPSRLPEFEMIKPPNQSADVVIAITETDAPVADKPMAEDQGAKQPRVRPQPPPLTIPKKARLPQARPKPESSLRQSAPSPPPDRAPSAAEVPLPRSSTNTLAPARKSSESSPAETPVMRSMFPTYNPNLPLSRQEYHPTGDSIPDSVYTQQATASSWSNPYRNSQSTAQPSADPLNPARVIDTRESPLRRSESLKRADAVSSSEQLASLWDIANGQAYHEAAESYTLELNCDSLDLGKEIINFSAVNSTHVYTLAASLGHSSPIQLSRANPNQPETRIPICDSVLIKPSRQDPMICSVFPKLAGLLALDESSTEAINQGMDRAASEVLQAEAIGKAQEREASMLLWDADSGRFCILHPTLLDNAATTLPIEITPNPASPSQIAIFAPETHTPLLTLNMQSLTLSIHAHAITALPSLYLLDTLMTSLLTLLLHLHRSCAIPQADITTSPNPAITQEDMLPYFPPPPPSLQSRGGSTRELRSGKAPRSQTRTQLPSFFRSNKSVRSVAATSNGPSAFASPALFGHQHSDKDIEMGDLTPDGTSISTSLAKQKQKPPKGMFSVDDENLPSGTRAVLKFLYWVFEVLYWLLGVLVQVLAAAVVAGGKLITKL